MLTFRDTGKEFDLKRDLSKLISNKNHNVDLAGLADKKLMYDFEKEIKFDTKAQSKKSARYRTLIKLLKSPGLVVSASGVSKTIILSSDANELCDRLKLIFQEKNGGKISDIITQEIVVIVDKFLEFKCISKKQHKQIVIKCNLLHK